MPALRAFLAFVALLGPGLGSPALAAPFAYIPSAGDHRLSVIDLATGATVTNVATSGFPLGVAVNPSGSRYYVATYLAGKVDVFHGSTHERIASVEVAPGPYAVAVSRDGSKVFVSESGVRYYQDTVSVIDASTNRVTKRLTVGLTPYDMLMNAAGTRLYVACWDSNSISVIDTATLEVVDTLRASRQPGPMALSPEEDLLFIGALERKGVGSTVDVVDLRTGAHVGDISIGNFPMALVTDPVRRRLFVANNQSGTVSVVDLRTLSESSTLRVGTRPIAMSLHPDGESLYVVNNGEGTMHRVDLGTLAITRTLDVGSNPAGIGHFIGPAAPLSAAGVLTGLWWNPAENGWGMHLTQRRDVVFAAWFTYDAAGAPAWYVASECRIQALACPACIAGTTCSAPLYRVTGPRFFAPAFDPSAVQATAAGTLQLGFRTSGEGSMTYEVGGQRRTVPVSRQVFATGGEAPQNDYTDLWWDPQQSGWGLAITQQSGVLFLAWYVYDDGGRPTWLVASNCAMNADRNACAGTLYRTTGPALGPTFDASRVRPEPVGDIAVSFSGPDNGTIRYTVDGAAGSRSITRQAF